MLEHVLPVTGPEFQSAQKLHQFGMKVVDTYVKCRLFPFFLDDARDFLLGLIDHLLDPRRMDTPIHDELLEAQPRYFPLDRVKA